MALLTDDQKMLQETAASFLREEGSIAKQLRHWRDTRLHRRIRKRLLEAVRGAWPDRDLHSRGSGRARAGQCRGGAGAGRDRPQSDAVSLPYNRGRWRSRHRGNNSCGAMVPRHPVRRDGPCACHRREPQARARTDRAFSRAAGQRLRAQRRQAVRSPRQFRRHGADPCADRGIAGRPAWPHPVRRPEGRRRSRKRDTCRQLESRTAQVRQCRAGRRCGGRGRRQRLGVRFLAHSTLAGPALRPSWSALPRAQPR